MVFTYDYLSIGIRVDGKFRMVYGIVSSWLTIQCGTYDTERLSITITTYKRKDSVKYICKLDHYKSDESVSLITKDTNESLHFCRDSFKELLNIDIKRQRTIYVTFKALDR